MNTFQRGIIADALVAAGATLLLLTSTARATRSWIFIAVGIALVLAGLALQWGVPRPTFRLRMMSSLVGLLAGYAIVAPEGPASWLAIATAVVLLAGLLSRARSAAPRPRGRHRAR